MYAVRRWDEEVVKWLAVATCLAMIGMAVMPGYCSANWYFTLRYHPEGAAIAIGSTLYEGSIIISAASALVMFGCLGPAGIAALAIMATPILLE